MFSDTQLIAYINLYEMFDYGINPHSIHAIAIQSLLWMKRDLMPPCTAVTSLCMTTAHIKSHRRVFNLYEGVAR